jgi:hypothetical protein
VTVVGTLVAESLEPGRVIEFGLTLRRLQRIEVDSPAPDQPVEWTLIDFMCPDDGVEEFARQLSQAMRAGSWYCDFSSDQTKFVVFSDRMFAFARGDRAANQEAIAYARTVGVPEAQLDWKF